MSESAIWIFLFGVLSVFPFFPLRHVPILDGLKIPLWKLILYAAVIMLIQGFSFLYMSIGTPFGSSQLAWHRKLFMIPYVLLTLHFTKDNKSKTLFMDFFMVGIVMAVIDFAYIADRTWFAQYFAVAPYRTDVLVRGTITILIYPPLYFIFKKALKPIMSISTVTVWRYLTALPFVFAVISIITTMEAFAHEISYVILSIRISVIVGSILVCTLLAKVVRQLELVIMAQEKNKHSERLLALQGTRYEELAKNIEQTRSARHDLRHQLAAISTMAEQGEYDKLLDFVNQSLRAVSSGNDIIFCENYTANCVISHYAALAQHEEIPSMDIKCVLANDTGVDDIDLCVLLGNLLENAIEGCKTVPQEKRNVKMRIGTYAGALLIVIDNTFDGILQMEDGEHLSRKRGGQKKGVGLTSVKAVVRKYEGELSTQEKDGWFMVSARMLVHKK